MSRTLAWQIARTVAVPVALCALPTAAAPNYVQGNCFSNATRNTSASVTLDAVDAGDLLVVAAAFVDSAAGVVSMTDSLGTPFTAIGSVGRSATEGAQVFYGVSDSSGTDVLTAAWSAPVSVSEIFVHEYSGVSPGTAVLGWVSRADAGRPVVGGPLVTSRSVELLFAHVIADGSALAVKNGFTLEQGCFGDATADLLAPTAGSHSAEFDNSRDAGNWVVTLAAFGPPPSPERPRVLAVGCDQSSAPGVGWDVVALAGVRLVTNRRRSREGRALRAG